MENKIIIAETKRLILRKYQQEDLQDLYEYLSDREVVEYEPYKPLTFDETKENLKWRIGTDEMIAVELKQSRKMIGNVYMGKREFETLEMGYVFNRNCWGHGYAAESCRRHFQTAYTESMQNATPLMSVHGNCLKHWDFRERLISEKMYISGRMRTEK